MDNNDTPPPAGIRVHCSGALGGDFWHEGEPGWPLPARIRLRCLDGISRWFRVEGGQAVVEDAPPDARSAYYKNHSCCPRCGGKRVIQTLTGLVFPYDDPDSYEDYNIALCTGCGWQGKIHRMVPPLT